VTPEMERELERLRNKLEQLKEKLKTDKKIAKHSPMTEDYVRAHVNPRIVQALLDAWLEELGGSGQGSRPAA
jgi:hypothetical protein